MSEGNGSPVTWRELNLALGPIREDIREMRGDMKELLRAHAGDEAVSSWMRFWFGTVAIGVLGSVATLVWLAVGG